ncbi:MAG TPA: hypothetical protein PLY08_02690 [Bacillota bacterium]|nr:hypothetical protein [Bacillota bacterium]
MSSRWIEWIATVLITLLFAAGWLCVFREHIRLLHLGCAMRHRLRADRRQKGQITPMVRYVRNVLSASFHHAPDERVVFTGLALLFALMMLLSLRIFSWPASLFLSCVATSLPLLLWVVKLELQQKKGSREGLSLVSELYRHYWTNHKNIYVAIESVLNGEGDYPVFRKLLYRLLLKLRSTGSPAEVREAVDQFAFAAGTVWGKMLGVCIRLAAEKGIDVSGGLRDISAQLSEANTRAQERDRLNSESARMTLFLVPVLYIGTLGISVLYLGLAPAELLRNQFTTPEGFLFFTASLVLFVINLAALELLRNQKIDY